MEGFLRHPADVLRKQLFKGSEANPLGGIPLTKLSSRSRFARPAGGLVAGEWTSTSTRSGATLTAPRPVDVRDWTRVRAQLSAVAGPEVFDIWLATIELHAVDDAGALVLLAPRPTRAWVRTRFGQLLTRAGESIGRQVLIAAEAQWQALTARGPGHAAGPAAAGSQRGGQ